MNGFPYVATGSGTTILGQHFFAKNWDLNLGTSQTNMVILVVEFPAHDSMSKVHVMKLQTNEQIKSNKY